VPDGSCQNTNIKPGKRCSVQCPSAYEYAGAETAYTCRGSGQWKPAFNSVCIRKYFVSNTIIMYMFAIKLPFLWRSNVHC